MSAVDALAYIEKTRDNAETVMGVWSPGDVLEFLETMRLVLLADPDHVVTLQQELAEARADLEGEKAAELFMTILYTSAIRHVEGERDRARALAVRLEQDLALFEVGIGRRPL